MKRLYKSNTNFVLSGVLGGLGEYYEVDPTLLRLAFVVLVLVTGGFPGVVAYIIAAIIVPNKPNPIHMHHSEKQETKPEEKPQEKKEEPKTETTI